MISGRGRSGEFEEIGIIATFVIPQQAQYYITDIDMAAQ